MRGVLLFLILLFPLLGARAQGTSAWQQRVDYRMEIDLDAATHRFTGTQVLTLENNSPDTLSHVYYHLYFNAFQPTSLMAERNRHLPDADGRVVPRIFDLVPNEVGYHEVEALSQNGRPLAFRVNDTVLRAELAEPLPPGESATFEMRFNSQVPLQTRRSGRDSREGIDYSMSQWYPKLAHYDSRGWHADPYIGREFYAPFGRFDVRITLPADYTLGATGVLQNPDEIGHGYGQREVSHAPGTRLTWHFVADDVHDFAWAADRDYVHDRFEVNGLSYHLLYQPNVSEGWTFMRRFVPAVMEYLSQRFGAYAYPQFTVAQAGDGGMEYPMINFITGGRTPQSLIGVTVHEAAHEWFYAMLGINESDHGWMDEGFTSFATDETIAALFDLPPDPTSGTRGVMALQENGLFEKLDTPSDAFHTNRAYSVATYGGGQMIAEQLGYVVGDDVRDEIFREFVRQYRFRHPQPEDFERVAEQVSGVELDWFFEQLTNTERRMDYAVARLRSLPAGGSGWQTALTLARRDDLIYPLDVRLDLADGSELWVTIPTGEMYGAKAVPVDWYTAEPWGWTHPTYTLRLPTNQRVVGAEIDPLGRTPDHNRLNNATRMPRDVAFLRAPTPSLDHYSQGWRPLATFADRFGVGVGVQLRGTYWMNRHQTKAMLTVYPQAFDPETLGGETVERSAFARDRAWYDAVDYALGYSTPLHTFSPRTRLSVSAAKHLGVMENRVEVAHTFGRFAALGRTRGTVRLYANHLLQPTQRGFVYNNSSAFQGDHQAYLGASFEAGRGFDRMRMSLDVGGSLLPRRIVQIPSLDPRSPMRFPLERSSATRLTIEARKDAPVGPLTVRASTMIGFGNDALAHHRVFRMGGATFEDTWRNTAARQLSALDRDLVDELPFQTFSGVGPVGYSLSTNYTYVPGNSPMSTQAWMGSLEVALPRLHSAWLSPLEVTAFSGAGIASGATSMGLITQKFALDNLIADAGFGLTYDVSRVQALRRWTLQSDFLQTLRLAARFPLWVSDPELISPDEDAFAFRYLFGIQMDL